MTKKPTARADATRQKKMLIIEAAVYCFIKKGFHQTSIRDIATVAKISVGNLYNHFQNKEALIAELAVVEADEITSLLASLDQSGDPSNALFQFVDRYLEYTSGVENVALTIEFMAEASRNRRIGALFSKTRADLAAALRDILRQGQTDNIIDRSIDTKQASEFILDIIEGLALRSTVSELRPGKPARQELGRLINRYVGNTGKLRSK